VKVTTERLEGSKVALDVECPSKVVDEALRSAYRKIVRQVTIPGFRRGKAPRSLVQRYYGAELFDEAVQQALPQEYIKAVEETGISPVGDPEFSDIHFVEGEPLRFRAVVYVKPEVELGDYNSISVPFETPTVSEEDVDEQVEMLRQRMAELRPMEDEKPLEQGNYATCHVKSLETSKMEFDQDLNCMEVGREYNFIPGLGEALVGLNKGEVKRFTATYPPREDEEALTVEFEVEVKEVYEKHLPEDIEEIANNVGKASAEELRKDIKEQLMEVRLRMAREQHSEKVEEELFEATQVEIPEVMISGRARTLMERFMNRLADSGMNLENYLTLNQVSLDELQAEFLKQAEQDVRRELVLDAVAEKEEVPVPEESVDKVVEGLAAEMNQDPKAVKTTLEIRGALDDIRSQLRRIEALNLIASKAAVNAGTPLPPVEEQENGDDSENIEAKAESVAGAEEPESDESASGGETTAGTAGDTTGQEAEPGEEAPETQAEAGEPE
jgi:trigger factor